MNKTQRNIFIAVAALIVIGAVVLPHVSFAAKDESGGWLSGQIVNIVKPTIDNAVSIAAYIALTICSKILWFSGTLLNGSMNATLGMSGFVSLNTSIGEIWKVVRDFSSMFFIFFLLYASIQTIFGIQKANVKGLIINIVIAGVLVNFSLFIVRVGIDASNMMSLGFYNAIAPNTAAYDGGISDAFMQSLHVGSIYDSKDVAAAKNSVGGQTSDTPASKILIAGVMGSIIMIIAAGSFFVVALLMIARIAILMLVLILSPIYFAGFILPGLKGQSKKIFDLFVGQLTFLPVYLMLNYLALRILASPGFNQLIFKTATPHVSFAAAITGQSSEAVAVVLNYVIVIVLINAALVGAVAAAQATGKLIGVDIMKYVNMTRGAVKAQTIGRAAYGIQKSETFKNVVSLAPEFLGRSINNSVGNLAKSDFGSKELKGGFKGGVDSAVKAKKDFYKSLGEGDKEQGKARQDRYFNKLSSPHLMGFMFSTAKNNAAKDIKKEREKKELADQLRTNQTKLKKLKDDIKTMKRVLGPGQTALLDEYARKNNIQPDTVAKRMEDAIKEAEELEKLIQTVKDNKREEEADKLADKVKEGASAGKA